jgi:hypothetical protein
MIVQRKRPKEYTSLHEAGHVVVAMALGFPVERVTVEPDGEAFGRVTFSDEVWNDLDTRLEDRGRIFAGGMAAELQVFGRHWFGGVDPSYSADDTPAFSPHDVMTSPGGDGGSVDLRLLTLTARAKGATEVSPQVDQWVREARAIISANGLAFHTVCSLLMERGTLTGADLAEAVGDCFLPPLYHENLNNDHENL